MLTLYLAPGFSSMAPHIALHEIGVDFETRWISFEKRQQYSPDYLALNPEGKVPTLLVDGPAKRSVGDPLLSCPAISRNRSISGG
jgi:glutathione S-transferase